MRGAEILADCISKGKLLDYDKMWKKKYGNEIRIALYFKNIYESLSEKELSVIFQVCKMSAKKIETIGDFESHSSMILELIKDRDIQEKLGSVLWQMFKENLLIRV
jgi:flavin-dependent dehydrogenase